MANFSTELCHTFDGSFVIRMKEMRENFPTLGVR
jgi:hypothetical protein